MTTVSNLNMSYCAVRIPYIEKAFRLKLGIGVGTLRIRQ